MRFYQRIYSWLPAAMFLFVVLTSPEPLYSQCPLTVTSFPYVEDFESGPGGWSSGGTGNDWALGIPNKPTINTAASGANCWVTGGLTGSFYNFSARTWVESPCFNFTNLPHPYVYFSLWWESERQYDGATFQYSLDGGNSWTNVGATSDPVDCRNTNWFNANAITHLSNLATVRDGWSGNIQATQGSCLGGNGSQTWLTAKHCMPYLAGKPEVRFRFAFGAGSTCNAYDGIAFDNFHIENAAPVQANFTVECAGSDTLRFVDQSAFCPDSWSWNFGDPDSGAANQSNASSPAHVFSGPGAYTVTLSAGSSCAAGSDTSMTITLAKLDISSTAVLCPGDHNGTATVQVSPGSGSPVFSWNSVPPQSAATAVNLPGGIYTVTVTGVGLCPATAAVTVAEPGPLQYQTTTTPAYCGFSVGTANIVTTGGTAPYNYVWLPAVSTSNSAENLPPGNYAVWIKDNNGCRDSLYLQIAPATIQVQVLDNQPVSCPGAEDGKLEVRPNGGAAPFSFSWSTLAGNGPFAANLPSGNYTVTISDTNGCTASLSAAVGQPEPLAFEVQASDLQCPGDQNGAIRIENASGGTPPFRFALNQGALGAASTFTGLAASAYFVRMEDAKGCGLADTVNLIEPSPLQVFAGADTAVFQGNPIRLAGFVSDPIRVGQYSWLPAADLDCPDCPETLALPVRSTQFIFAVTDSNGCVFSDSLLVVVHPGNVYLPNAIRPESVQFNERFTVFAGGNVDQVVSLQVFDRWGNLFFERQNFPASVPSEGWDGHAPDGTPAPAGVYVFVARLRYIDGAEQVFSGSVLVLR